MSENKDKNKNGEDDNSPNVKRSPSPSSDEEISAKKTRRQSFDNINEVSIDDRSNTESENVQTDSRRANSSSSSSSRLNHFCNAALRRWQSKQLAQSIVDNAINKVLGDLGSPPPANIRFDIVSPQIIENEGVAVAIRQQGLQRRNYVTALSSTKSWNGETGTDSSEVEDRADKMNNNSENKKTLPNDNESLVQPEDLLNQAVSCAISRKGLASVSPN
ncbi:hypothetical protein CHUAL_002777 [Chamberlinius hualienensis]